MVHNKKIILNLYHIMWKYPLPPSAKEILELDEVVMIPVAVGYRYRYPTDIDPLQMTLWNSVFNVMGNTRPIQRWTTKCFTFVHTDGTGWVRCHLWIHFNISGRNSLLCIHNCQKAFHLKPSIQVIMSTCQLVHYAEEDYELIGRTSFENVV